MEISFDFQGCDEKVLVPLLDKKPEVKQIISGSLIKHPFVRNTLDNSLLPLKLKVNVVYTNPSIYYGDYPRNVILSLGVHSYWGYTENDYDIWDIQTLSSGKVVLKNYPRINPQVIRQKPFRPDRLKSILYHEFGHFYDAIFNESFGYDKERKPKDNQELLYWFYNLWDCYIDGRLESQAPYDYEDRVSYSRHEIRTYLERAYRREFNTFDSLLQASSEILDLIKRSTIDQVLRDLI